MPEVVLLTHKGCPICPFARQVWEELKALCDFQFRDLEVYTPEGLGVVKKFGIRGVPTTIIDGKVAFIGVPEKSAAMEKLNCHKTTE